MKPKVFIARPIQQAVVDHVKRSCDVRVHPEDAPMTAAHLAEAVADVEGLMSVGGNIDEDLLSRAPKLRVIANIGRVMTRSTWQHVPDGALWSAIHPTC